MAETSKLIANKKAAKAERERKERERLAHIKREKEERARQTRVDAQRRNAYNSTARSLDYVMVNFESVCGFSGCIDKNLQISGGPGRFSPSYSAAISGAIHKGYNGGLAGQYRWSAQFDNNFCSGTFYVSGQKRNISLSIHPNCYGFNVHEY